jgi:hypothetical protein
MASLQLVEQSLSSRKHSLTLGTILQELSILSAITPSKKC